MLIIDSQKEYDRFYEEFKNSDSVIIPIFQNDFIHPKLTGLSLVWVYLLRPKSDYIILIDHSESVFEIPKDLIIKDLLSKDLNNKFISNKKELIYNHPNQTNLIDIELLHFIETGNLLPTPVFKSQQFYKNLYPKFTKVNCLIPVSKWIEYFELIKPIILNTISSFSPLDRAYNFYNNILIPGISSIEMNGLKVDSGILNKNIIKRINIDPDTSLMYSQYNIYTTTGRPSNRFNGINFAALNKEDGSRNVFISRFDKGVLLEYDFESYHLRLIANMIGYSFPPGAVHDYLGKQYFNKQELTDEEYNASKNISFKQLYGGVSSEYKHIPFFKLTSEFIEKLWKDWKSKGYIESPISGRRIYKKTFPTINSQKLFNYFIQLIETETNIVKIDLIHKHLESYTSKLIMYTYDALLFDFNLSDGKRCITGIKNILEAGNFVIRKYIGNSYGKMLENTK